MKHLFTLLSGMLVWYAVQSQGLVAGEYYIDVDPGPGLGTPFDFPAADSIEMNITVGYSQLDPGFHRLYVRFLTDSSEWTIAEPRTFYVQELPDPDHTLVAWEYHIDDEPGVGSGTWEPLAGGLDSLNQTFTINYQDLDPGFHNLRIRVKNAHGQWSLAERRVIYVIPDLNIDHTITGGEFFVDAEPGVGNGTSFELNPSDSINGEIALLMPELSIGTHQLYIRVRNSYGQWTLLEPRPFEVCETYGATAEAQYQEDAGLVLFEGVATYADSVSWNLGDGTITGLINPIHAYEEAGVYTSSFYAGNDCGSMTSTVTVTVEGLEAVSPSMAAVGSVTTFTLHGFGFIDGMTVEFVRDGFDPLVPVQVSVLDDQTAEVVMNLVGQSSGMWSVEADIPLAGIYILEDAVELIEAAFSNEGILMTSVQINMQRTGRRSPATMHIQNLNPMDILAVPVVFRDISDVEQILYGEQAPLTDSPFFIETYQYLLDNGISNLVMEVAADNEATNSALTGLIIPKINGDAAFNVPFFTRRQVDGYHKRGSLMIYPQLDPISQVGDPVYQNEVCLSSFVKVAVETVAGTLLNDAEWESCFATWNDSLFAAISAFALDGEHAHKPVSLPASITSLLVHMQMDACVSGMPSLSAEDYKAISAHVMANMVFLNDAAEVTPICPQFQGLTPDLHPSANGISADRDNEFCELAQEVGGFALLSSAGQAKAWCTLNSSGVDPNTKTGPGDNDEDIYVMPGDIAAYNIAFENLSTATASVEEVLIIDSLDVTRLDISTFRWGLIALGDSIIIAPEQEEKSQLILNDLRPALPHFLLTQLTLDTASAVATWRFTALDTLTLQPLEVGIGGFLPPNVNGTEGLGDVHFFVNFRSDLVTGDTISNRAAIYFDFNAPIITSYWNNAVDITPPLSEVTDLPVNTEVESFMVSWSGEDAPAGIANYTVYVSENDGPFLPWIIMTDTLQSVFNGVMGNTYKFYSVAVDNAGNWELQPQDPWTEYDAITTLSVGVVERQQAQEITTYPVPATDQVHILMDAAGWSSGQLEVRDVSGRLVLPSEIVYVHGGKIRKTVDIRSLAAGVYILSLRSGDSVREAYFIKAHP